MKILKLIPILLLALVNSRCTDNSSASGTRIYKYLALGDSYTIGESVCDTCRFPEQLKDSLEHRISNSRVDLKIIATTGWTTTNLIDYIHGDEPSNDYDLVTLLIGVNNQYQHKPFSLYQTEFPELVNIAIAKAKGDKSNVIVVSIPDYAFTPYGQSTGNQAAISAEIQQYNTFAQDYCAANDIQFVNITDITQQGLNDTSLVAFDGLHPSAKAHTQFTQRVLPKAITVLRH